MYDTPYSYTYEYGASYGDPTASATIMGVTFATIVMFTIFAALIAYVISSFCYMNLFKKAGIEAKKAWIPFYNNWIFFELGGQEGWKSILMFIPYVGGLISYIFMVISAHEINKKLGRDSGSTVLFIFLPLIWFIVIAIDRDEWNDSLGKPSLAKGTIIGYQVVEETVQVTAEQATAPAQTVEENPVKTTEATKE